MKKESIIVVGDKSYMKSKVILLPTEKAENCIIKNNDGSFWKGLVKEYFTQEYLKTVPAKSFHLYLLSDEEIKEGDWYFAVKLRTIGKNVGTDCKEWWNAVKGESESARWFKKIIGSTDELAFLWGNHDNRTHLPRPSNEFIQAYCKATGDIEEVLIEMECTNLDIVSHGFVKSEYAVKISPDNTITIKKVSKLTPEEKFEIDNALQDKFDEGYTHRMNDEKNMYSSDEMFLNMQYYMEYCQLKGYTTPQDWIENHKHF